MNAGVPLIAATLCFAASLTLAQAAAPGCPSRPVYVSNGFDVGEHLHLITEAELRAVVRGFVGGLLISTAVGANESCMRFYEACFVGKTDSQLAAVVRQFVSENPGRWDQPASVLMLAALGGMCRQQASGG